MKSAERGAETRWCGVARRWYAAVIVAVGVALFAGTSVADPANCTAERPEPLTPTDPELCKSLIAAVRDPSALPLDQYEAKLNQFFGNYCHRDTASGWRRDKHVRDTGPFTATLAAGAWQGTGLGTHAPVVIWYSPDMADWLVRNRSGESAGTDPTRPIPDGAIMVKEMFPYPAAACADVDPVKLYPTSGAAIMIRDSKASHDGWFWGWYGFGPQGGWSPDLPPSPNNGPSNMGFAQYCMNCHASAKDNLTFASPRNIEGEPGRPLVYLSQSWSLAPSPSDHHRAVTLPPDDVRRLGEPLYQADRGVDQALRAYLLKTPTWDSVPVMPSASYDNTWVAAGGPHAADQFVTSSQCLGCHDAGSTGLQFDMTVPNPHGDNLINLSPYGTWRSSPMGLAGRDPFFFAQLASEIQTFHPAPDTQGVVQDTCLGCHGIQGQRQFHIDTFPEAGKCVDFTREMVDAVPWPDGNPTAAHAKYGALARDGISCTSCHRMALGHAAAGVADAPENACIAERQEFLNPDNTGFARTFTGSFFVGGPDKLIGPFEKPQVKPMKAALGITSEHNAAITSSEVCGSCHSVHLPVLQDGNTVTHIYEQTTYPEWAFSAYRTGTTPDGTLPLGPGSLAQSCQECHMPSKAADGTPMRSKIASIQEYSNFPETENNLAPEDIDLSLRDGFAAHTLVGLNVFLIKIAQQFPDVLGIPTQDPMMGARGVDPLVRTEQAMLDMASNETAEVTVSKVSTTGGRLQATVTVRSRTGHKLPSGVGFRRAFLEFQVLDGNGATLWASGRTNAAGALVDQAGTPLDGEYWWTDDCKSRIRPDERLHQPHYQRITGQNQAQIYQELVSTPPSNATAQMCGPGKDPQGMLTTSFLSICTTVKDNRILPQGYLSLPERTQIAKALGATEDLAKEAGSVGVDGDPDYDTGGGDSLVYDLPLSDLPAGSRPIAVQATLYYQAAPPFYLQDRFCTAKGDDPERLKFLVGHLNIDKTAADDWKLKIVSSGAVALP
ncbi:hypothetical protein GCM10007874_22120 [Labrys miyagiensis]|uniref:Cytochrome P460 domain-containing protein n=1 Tax=Labrys miyagiensis TaxID=346912 RepID=A0ABQ6CJZ4_9HYPH|nr:cytochrome P460 family protein [Labrys miyagiensis]GLS19195.1 hypothetical protein GCM10007874_22120 [Labrys miyagiensis]